MIPTALLSLVAQEGVSCSKKPFPSVDLSVDLRTDLLGSLSKVLSWTCPRLP